MIKSVLLLFLVMVLSSCATKTLKDYENNKPAIDVKAFFNGPLKAYGIVKNRSGSVIRYFTADINASWQGNTGVLDETFYFNDGEVQKRIWTLTEDSDGQFTAEANDVTGKHAMKTAGNALFMTYILNIPYKGSTLAVNVDDKMFLVNKTRIINESIMSKWGVRVASVQLVIEK